MSVIYVEKGQKARELVAEDQVSQSHIITLSGESKHVPSGYAYHHVIGYFDGGAWFTTGTMHHIEEEFILAICPVSEIIDPEKLR